MSSLARFFRYLMFVSAAALVVVVLLTSLDVISANLRGRPLTGVYEIVDAALIFIVFLGIPETFRTERNITVDVIDHFVSPRTIGALRIAAAVVTVVFFALMGWSMIRPALDAYDFGDMKADTGIRLWVMWVPVLLGTALAIVAAVVVMMRVLRWRGSVHS